MAEEEKTVQCLTTKVCLNAYPDASMYRKSKLWLVQSSRSTQSASTPSRHSRNSASAVLNAPSVTITIGDIVRLVRLVVTPSKSVINLISVL